MDEFDRQIVNAKQPYEPKPNFVEGTMNQLKNQTPHRRWSIKFWAPALAGVAALAVIAFIIFPKPTNPTGVAGMTNQGGTSQASQSTSLPAGSDNASLDSDLSSIQSSMNQTGNDQSGAENAINDNQQQISVPTE